MNLGEVIALAGGEVDPAELPPEMDAGAYRCFARSIMQLRALIRLLAEGRESPEIVIAITHSTSLVCRARKLADDHAVVLVPLGLAARLRVHARLLLTYWENEIDATLLTPLLDTVPPDYYEIPPALLPLYTDDPDPTRWWAALNALDRQLDLPKQFEPDVLELIHLATTHLVLHEIGHVWRRHFGLSRAAARGETPSALRHLSDHDLFRALELDADWHAATTEMRYLFGLVADFGGEIERGILRLGYAIPLVLGLYDARRKFVQLYNDGRYLHPMIRHEIINGGHRMAFGDDDPASAETVEQLLLLGANRCVRAYQSLSIDALAGKFGDSSRGDNFRFVPINAMSSDAAFSASPSTLRLMRWTQEAWNLFSSVRAYLDAESDARGRHPSRADLAAEGAGPGTVAGPDQPD